MMFRKFTILYLWLILLQSCQNDFQGYIMVKPVPVIYGLISPEDSVYQILLLKSYVGPGSAIAMAKIPDSIYYKNFEAYLELRHLDGHCVLRKKMELTDGPLQTEGIFGRNPNKLLTLKRADFPLNFLFDSPKSYGYVSLNIHINDTEEDVSSITPLFMEPVIIKPKSKKGYSLALYSANPFEITWQKDFFYYEARVIFHYELFRNDAWTKKSAVLTNRFEPEKTDGNAEGSYMLVGDAFLTLLANAIKDYRPDDVRKFVSMDFSISAADPSLYQYMSTMGGYQDIELGTFTNIENGLGIFALSRRVVLTEYSLDLQALDSLVSGRFTKHLQFKKW